MEILQPVHKIDRHHFFRAVCGTDGPKALAQNTELVTCKACLVEIKAQEVEKALGSDDTVEAYVQGK